MSVCGFDLISYAMLLFVSIDGYFIANMNSTGLIFDSMTVARIGLLPVTRNKRKGLKLEVDSILE